MKTKTTEKPILDALINASESFADTTKTAHTPRPWKIEPEDTAPDGQIFIEHREGVICRIDSRTIIDEANARLIAAAPDMLHTLKHLEAELQAAFDDVPAGVDAWMSLARAAIAKAEGSDQ